MTTPAATTITAPVSAIDPFAEENILNPRPMHEELRALGDIVFLEEYGCHAVLSHALVSEVLNKWEDFISGAGIGVTNYHKTPSWRPPAAPTEVDPPHHDAPRRVLSAAIGPQVLRGLKDTWQAEADRMVDAALARGEIDAVPELTAAYPLKVFPDAVGLPVEGREHLLPYGKLVFDGIGPRDRATFLESAAQMETLSKVVTDLCQRDSLAEGSIGMSVWEAADQGELLPEQAPLVVRSLLSAGLDTTVHGLSAIISAFAAHPEQWDRVRERPELARSAFDEAVRWGSPLQVLFHTTSRDLELGGVAIPEDSKVMMFLGAANRDPLRWENPDEFLVTRDPSGHLGFGMGIHQCVGQHVARLEATCMIQALAAKVSRFEATGPAVRVINNALQSYSSMPMRLHAA